MDILVRKHNREGTEENLRDARLRCHGHVERTEKDHYLRHPAELPSPERETEEDQQKEE